MNCLAMEPMSNFVIARITGGDNPVHLVASCALLAIFAGFEREILRQRTRAGVSKSAIARRLTVGRTSVTRILGRARALAWTS